MIKIVAIFIFFSLPCFWFLKQRNLEAPIQSLIKKKDQKSDGIIFDTSGTTILKRIPTPEGFKRLEVNKDTYASFLRNFKLKNHDAVVKYFNGTSKTKPNVYCAVLDIDCGSKDLQQCADAVMRLRGEYLFHQKLFDQIHFNFLSDKKAHYFLEYSKQKTDYNIFRKYMDYVFSYANTGSLADELYTKKMKDIEGGDVLIQKRIPYGHAVTVMDVAVNEKGEKLYLLAQSYMPAQDIQVLVNPIDKDLSPWYRVIENGEIITPEWLFTTQDLKSFEK